MRYAKYVGRVGGLAVALGVGVSVATTPGIAWAAPADSAVSSDDDAPADDAAQPSDTDTTPAAEGATTDPDEDEDADAEDEGEEESAPTDVDEDDDSTDTDDDDSDTDTDVSDEELDPGPDEDIDVEDEGDDSAGGGNDALTQQQGASETNLERNTANLTSDSPGTLAADSQLDQADDPDTGVVDDVVDDVTLASSLAANSTMRAMTLDAEQAVTIQAPRAPSALVSLVSGVMKWVGALNPLASNGPLAPIDTPALWAVMAWTRRQFQHFLFGQASTEPDPLQTSQILARAAAVNAPPTANPTYGTPDGTTGAITGVLNAKDPEGTKLTYTLATGPANGSASVSSTGGFAYAPTQAARMRAGASPEDDVDSFVVRVSDANGAATDVRVNVPIYTGQLDATSGITVGSMPVGVATYGNRAYVANLAGNSVSVINTSTSQVIGTVKVGSAPTLLTVSADGTRVYVANRLSNSVSAINTSTNTVVKTYTVQAQPQGVAVNAANTRLYVTNSQSGTVSVVNTSTGAIVKNITVGAIPTGVVVSPDGTRVYVANRGSGTVSTISTSTNAVLSTIRVGSSPQIVALNSTGSRLYVTNSGSDNVSVLNTATGATVATIGVGDQPYGITISKDDSVAYVANGDGTVSAIDLRTNTKIPGKLQMGTTVGSMIALSPDGNKLWAGTSTGRTLQSASLVHLNTLPPTYPNPNAAAVRDDFNGPAGQLADSDLWHYGLAGPGGGMQQVYTDRPQNASLDGNGNLVMTAIEEQFYVPGYGTFDYTSAALSTRDQLEFTYGTVAARIKFPAEQGIHPAFFLIGADDREIGWPAAGEIDIFEIYSDDVHSGSAIHGPNGTTGGWAVSQQTPAPVSDEFHEYWVRWEPNKITVGIDNTVTRVFTPDDLPPGAAWTFNDRPMRIVMNLAVGGDSGQPDATTDFPVSVTYDYISYTPLASTAV